MTITTPATPPIEPDDILRELKRLTLEQVRTIADELREILQLASVKESQR